MFTVSKFLALVACIVFALSAFIILIGAAFPVAALMPLGLAFLAASFVVP